MSPRLTKRLFLILIATGIAFTFALGTGVAPSSPTPGYLVVDNALTPGSGDECSGIIDGAYMPLTLDTPFAVRYVVDEDCDIAISTVDLGTDHYTWVNVETVGITVADGYVYESARAFDKFPCCKCPELLDGGWNSTTSNDPAVSYNHFEPWTYDPGWTSPCWRYSKVEISRGLYEPVVDHTQFMASNGANSCIFRPHDIGLGVHYCVHEGVEASYTYEDLEELQETAWEFLYLVNAGSTMTLEIHE